MLDILKDETVALVANKPSIVDFLEDCMRSINPDSMNWLQPNNAENAELLKQSESKSPSPDEDFEEKVTDRALQLLRRLYGLPAIGLNIRQFDQIIMEKVIVLAYMGHRRQRTQALIVLQQAVSNELGLRVSSLQKDLWEKYKVTLQSVYCRRMTMLVTACEQDWATQWETSITLIGKDLHRGSGLVNSLLKVEEFAFKSADPNRRLVDDFQFEIIE